MQEEIADWLESVVRDTELLAEDIRTLEERIESVTDNRLREALKLTLSSRKIFLDSLPDFRPTLVNETFEGSFGLRGTERTIELRVVEPGHTPSDVYLMLPAEKIAFLGDLAFFQSHPFLPSSDPQGWSKALADIGRMDFNVIVPGHGPSGTAADLLLVKQYLTSLTEMASCIVNDGGSEEEAARLAIPEPFDTWIDGMSRFDVNMRFLYGRLSKLKRQG